MPLGAGDSSGQYKIYEQIGRGGMTTDYKAYHFYNGDSQTAQVELAIVLDNETLNVQQHPEAKLLQVESYLENGECEKARGMLLGIIRNRSTYPNWVADIAEVLNNRLLSNREELMK